MAKRIFICLFVFVCAQAVFTQKAVSGTRSVNRQKIERRLAGTWSLVLVDNIDANGKRTQPYGPNPQGLLIFNANGTYAIQILRADRPKFVLGDKTKGTDRENQTLVLGTNTHFGRYTINSDNTITFKIEHAFFPNWEGTEQRRPFTLTDTEFRYTVPTTTNGAGISGEVAWKRIK